MKSTALFVLFLLSAWTSCLPSDAQIVLDSDGDILGNGGQYYIVPVLRGRGGGIGRTRTGNETCPLTVVQVPNEVDRGLPIIIASPYLTLFISEGFPLWLSFTFVPTCSPTPSQWTVVEDVPEGLSSVKLTGYENTVGGWFKIEGTGQERDYKLAFCPASTDACNYIGIHKDEDGNRLLVATNENPFIVRFVKVGQDATTIKNQNIVLPHSQ